jgi:Rrf2 family protein
VHCAIVLARMPEGTLLSTRTLAAHFGLPEAYLGKNLQAMVKAGLLQAATGPNGGFRLARPADQISVLQVVQAVEGRAAPFVCQEIRQRGTGCLPAQECTRPCAVSAVMADAYQAWCASLRGVTIADLCAQLPDSVRDPLPVSPGRRATGS